jgi:hypothetical protein
MFGGRLGLPELLFFAVLAVIIGVPIMAVRTKTQAGYYSLGLFFIALMSSREIHEGFGAICGAALVFLFVAAVPASIYWGISGRKSVPGMLRTSKIFFWLAFVMPLLEHWSESLNR